MKEILCGNLWSSTGLLFLIWTFFILRHQKETSVYAADFSNGSSCFNCNCFDVGSVMMY